MSTVKSVQALADTSIPTTTETVVATLPGVFEDVTGAPILVEGWAQVTIGTAASTITMRVRRGTDATGTLVGEANTEGVQTAAGFTDSHPINVIDTPGEGGPYTYVLTVQQVGATGNGACIQANIQATLAGPSGT